MTKQTYLDMKSIYDNTTLLDSIKTSVKNILGIKKYDVPGDPTKFINLNSYIGEQLDNITIYKCRTDILYILQKWEPRIENIKVDINSDSEHTMVITIQYEIKSINQSDAVILKIG